MGNTTRLILNRLVAAKTAGGEITAIKVGNQSWVKPEVSFSAIAGVGAAAGVGAQASVAAAALMSLGAGAATGTGTQATVSAGAASFAFADLYANGEDGFIYDPSQSGLSDGDPVTGATDRINSNDATQATAANQPVYDLTGGVHSFQTDGVDDWLRVPNFPIGSDFTAIFSLKNSVQETGAGSILRPLFAAADDDSTGATAGYYTMSFIDDGGAHLAINGENIQTAFTSDGSDIVLTFRKEGTSAKIFKDGVEIASGTLSTTSGFGTGDYALFGNPPKFVDNRAAKTDLYHVMIIDRALTAQEQSDAEALSAEFATSNLEAPEITQGASFPFDPVFGETLTIDPAVVTGTPSPTVTYEMQRGGTAFETVNDLEFENFVESDVGTSLSVLVTATNGVSPDDTEVTQTAPIVFSGDEDFTSYSIGDTESDIAEWNENVSIDIVVDADSPTGRAAEVKPNSNNPRNSYRNNWFSVSNNATTIDYVEVFYLVKLVQTDSRIGFMIDGGGNGPAGYFIRDGSRKHYIEGIEDSFNAPGVTPPDAGIGDIVAVRQRVEGSVSTLWVWNINDPEPADSAPTSQRNMGAPMTTPRPVIYSRLQGTGAGHNLYYASYGINTQAPRNSPIQTVPPEPADVMQYEAPAEQGATSVTDIDGGTMTITVEDV